MVPSTEKCKITTCAPLKIVLTEHQDHLLLQHMKKMLVDSSKNKNIAHFQVGYIYLPGIKQQRKF